MSRFDIELVGFDQREPPIAEFAAAFGIDVHKARALVARAPVIIKRDVDEEQAESFYHTLRDLGARVKLRKLATMHPSSAPPGSAPPPVSIPAPPALPFEVRGFDMRPLREGEPAPVPGIHVPSSRPPPLRETSVTPPTDQSFDAARGSFGAAVLSAYFYPFNFFALPGIVGVTLVAQIATYVPVVGYFLSAAVWISYLFGVIKHASTGKDGAPFGGDDAGLGDLVAAIVRCTLALWVPLALMIGIYVVLLYAGTTSVRLFAEDAEQVNLAVAPVFLLVLIGIWLLVLPATLMIAAHTSGWFGGMNLLAAGRLITRAPIGYATMLAGLAPVVALMIGASYLGPFLDRWIDLPFLPGLLSLGLFIVPALAGARILGLYIVHHEYELGLA